MLFTLFLSSLLACSHDDETAKHSDKKRNLQGEWILVSREVNRAIASKQQVEEEMRIWTIVNNRIVIYEGNSFLSFYGTYEIVTEDGRDYIKAKMIDTIGKGGNTVYYLFEVKDKMLTLCRSHNLESKPSDFSGKATVLERYKLNYPN